MKQKYQEFIKAIVNNDLNFFKDQKITKKLEKWRQKNSYYALRLAAQSSNIEILKYITDSASKQEIEIMTMSGEFGSFESVIFAAKKGNLEILKFLEKKDPELFPYMIDSQCIELYEAYHLAAINGHLNIIQFIEEKISDELEIQSMVEEDNYSTFRYAVINGHQEVADHLAKKINDHTKLKKIISDNNYQLFRLAADRSSIDILLYIEAQAPDSLINMLKALNFAAFDIIYKKINCTDYFYRILNITEILDFAELNYDKYQIRISTYIDLAAEKILNINSHISEDEYQKYYIILRNLIRRNDPLLLTKISKLIEHLTATSFIIHNDNELFKLAQSINNIEISSLLLMNSHVRALAQQNNFYQTHNELNNLAQIAENYESSMKALTQTQQELIKEIRDFYKPKLLQQFNNVKEVIENLKNKLIDLSPLKSIDIPDHGAKKEEFYVFYKEPFHTAWRYLSKPNPLLHSYAHYTDGISASINDEALEIIALFYLAAIDESKPPKKGNGTTNDRFNFFVGSLAEIGRAHNRDRTNSKNNDSDLYNEHDKPSCLNGVIGRILLSLQNHPFYTPLTPDTLLQAISSIFYQHFKKTFASLEQKEITSLYHAYTEYNSILDPDVFNNSIKAVIYKFNIQNNDLHNLLAEELDEERYKRFKYIIELQLAKKNQNGPNDNAHCEMFGAEGRFFEQLINIWNERQLPPVTVSLSTGLNQ